MKLQRLIDRMIDQAQESDPDGAYVLMLGRRPATEKDWPSGKKIYRWCPVAQSKLVPNYLVVLAPSPDNLRAADLFEYHGRVLSGAVTRHTVRRQSPVRAVPNPRDAAI
ncbi:hypothetical protein IWX81_000978 [Salinibacterium sp. CAN_S4]|uniref:hypothetical protein n=1 Tax=Salinibacterium sp. CAN_S4 TaxID=2787727 RepID=UPI0018EFECDD